jgi:PAS domain S-box-containing protein
VRRGGRQRTRGGGFRALLDALDDGVVVHEDGGRVRACNASAERMLGLQGGALEQAFGPEGTLTIVDEDGRPLGREDHPWHVALATHAASAPVTLGFEHPDGGVVWTVVSAQPLRRRRGRPHAVVTSLSDVTETRRVERELRQLVDQDLVTGLPNRRHFEEDLTRQVERSKRYGEQAVLMRLEVDRGGADDAAAIARVAEVLRSCLRTSDVLGRLGDHTFAAILPHASPAEAGEVAAKVRSALHFDTRIGFAAIDGRRAANDVIDAAVTTQERHPSYR